MWHLFLLFPPLTSRSKDTCNHHVIKIFYIFFTNPCTTLSLVEEGKWEDYFLPEQKKALEIKAKINQTDKEIDAMVYELYGLTDEEIAIIENESK